MAEQKQAQATAQKESAPEAEAKDLRNEEIDESTESVLGDIDDILDEMDEMLEPNAEEFVANYKQRGGQ